MNSKNRGKSSKSSNKVDSTPEKFQKFGSLVKKVDTSTIAALTVFLSSSSSWGFTCY